MAFLLDSQVQGVSSKNE